MAAIRIEIATDDGTCPTFLFGDTGAPAVLMFMDGVGMRPAMHAIAERIAGAGFHVMLPDLFYRLGPYTAPEPAKLFTDPAVRSAWMGRVAATIYKWLTPSALRLRPRELGVVHTYHGHVFHSYYCAAKTRLFIAIERALARFCADRIVAISERQRDEICRSFKVGRFEQFTVIPLGIDFDEIDSRRGRLRREIGVGADDVLVGVVGRLCEVKNHAMLIESAAKMKAAGAAFVIVGDGHLRAELEAQARASGLDGSVIFTGFRGDAASLYADFDIAALTSLNEGTPLALIEAMGCGCAAASTEVGGVADLMGGRRETLDGFTVWDHGVTAPSRDVNAFTNGLTYLIERPRLRREMGERGRAFVSSRLSKGRLVGDIENLYRGLIHDL